jgi:DNA-binding transcriptional MerR regulator
MSEVETWTLQELSELIGREVARRGIETPGGRVSAVPNARTIRYYTTLGLVDKPLGYDGGVARYGKRHLLQLLAVKTLQAGFLPLPQIQKRLLGRSDAELQKMVEKAPSARVAAPSPRTEMETWTVRSLAPGVSIVLQDAQKFREWVRQAGAAELRKRLELVVADLKSL